MYRRPLPKQPVTAEQLEDQIQRKQKLIETLEQEYTALALELHDDPHSIVASYIKTLKNYNEIKDLAQKFVGKIADQRRMTIQQVMDEMNVSISQ